MGKARRNTKVVDTGNWFVYSKREIPQHIQYEGMAQWERQGATRRQSIQELGSYIQNQRSLSISSTREWPNGKGKAQHEGSRYRESVRIFKALNFYGY
jgi:hypothetical protein